MGNTKKTIKMREINENEIEVDIPTISIILDLIGMIGVVMAIAGGIILVIDMLRQIL